MENYSWIFMSIITFLALLFKIFLPQPPPSRRKLLPPGPKPWPVIGNLNLLGSVPHQSLRSLSQKYGDLMLLHLGSRRVVVASSPETAKLFLKTHDASFASRPMHAGGKHTAYNYRDMTWAPLGPYWRQARRIYLSELFSPRRLDASEHVRADERRDFLSRLAQLSGEAVSLRDHLSRLSLCSMSRMVLGNKYFGEREGGVVGLEELQGLVDQWFVLNGAFNIGDWIPWVNFMDLQGYVKKMKGLSKDFDKFHDLVIDDHMEKRENEGKTFRDGDKDMVDLLLEMAENPNLEVKLTKDCVKGLLQDLLTGGTDSLTGAVGWAFQELMRKPEIIEKAREELDKVIGKERWVEESDYSRLPYIEAIIKETFRLHPLGTMLAPHYAIEDCNVAGYHIYKGTTVLVNVWAIGRDPRFWENAEEFHPERFLENGIGMDGHNFSFLPFGSGRRRCPGYNLGLRAVRATLANMLHGFTWKLPPGMKHEDISLEEHFGLTTHPKFPVLLITKPCLPLRLYSLNG